MTIDVRRRCESCNGPLREFASGIGQHKRVVFAACSREKCPNHNKPIERFIIQEGVFLNFSWWMNHPGFAPCAC